MEMPFPREGTLEESQIWEDMRELLEMKNWWRFWDLQVEMGESSQLGKSEIQKRSLD